MGKRRCRSRNCGGATGKNVLAVIRANVEIAKQAVAATARLLASRDEPISCDGAMDGAIITSRDAISADARQRLDLLIGKYLG